jgi:hypothetical protein
MTVTNLIDQLPYQLTKGVTATREGLYFKGRTAARHAMKPHQLLQDPHDGKYGQLYLPWGETAERLRYREGELWCSIYHGRIACYSAADDWQNNSSMWNLHRHAAILCDDAEAFRVLYQCIEEYGDE